MQHSIKKSKFHVLHLHWFTKVIEKCTKLIVTQRFGIAPSSLSRPFPFVLQRIKQPAIIVIWPWPEITVFTTDGSDFKDSMKE
jgi:hypothetical protein